MSNYQEDLERFGDPATLADAVVAPSAPQAVPDDTAVVKALVVLRALQAAGLKLPFDMPLDEAKLLWAARLGRFHIDVLTEAISDWIARPGTEFPSVGDVEANAEYVMTELQRELDNERAVNRSACPACDGTRWTRVRDDPDAQVDPVDPRIGTHMRPCPVCPAMRERSALYDDGHFTAQHIERGGCPSCWDYLPSHRHKHRSPMRAHR